MVNNFFHNTLPVEATNLAITGTKKCILGYRKFSTSIQNSVKTFSRDISASPIIQMFSYITEQAKKEANLQSTSSFKSRIKYNPESSIYHLNSSDTSIYFSKNKDYDLIL